MRSHHFTKGYHFCFLLCFVFMSTLIIADQEQQIRKAVDISGSWDSNMRQSYQIVQEGESFYWLDERTERKIWGTIDGAILTIKWSDRSGEHSLTGRITGYDSSGWPIRIEWSNRMVFSRRGRAAVPTPEEGWCCREGEIFRATPEECEEHRGRFFPSREEAEEFCRPERREPEEGWCCREGEIFRATPEECEEHQGRYFPSREEAEEFCRPERRESEEGWCCREGEIFRATPEECEEHQGRYFHSREEAEEFCRPERPGFELPREIRDEVHFIQPEYSIFSEYAMPLEEYEAKEVDVNTPEGIKRIRYIYVSSEEIKRRDLDPPVTDYPEGVGIVEGDILVDLSKPVGGGDSKQNSLVRAGCGPPMTIAILASAGTSDWKTLWPNREVPYVIAPLAKKHDGGQILTAMSWWAAAGIKFRPRKPEDGNRYMYIMKTSDWYSGSADGIGMDKDGGTRTIRIGYHVSTGLIAHEIGHGLGLFHVQQRTDRDKYVDIFWGNIKNNHLVDYCQYKVTKPTQWCPPQDRGGKDIGPYDFGSIMHYGSYTFGKVSATKIFLGGLGCILFPFNPECYKSKTYTKRTMQRKDQSTITANRSKPSQKEINAMKELYKNADKCGGMQSGAQYGVVKFGGTNTFNHEVDFCTNRLYSAYTKDYRTLVINIDSKSGDIPAKDFAVDLKTPRPQGGFDIISAINPGGNKKRVTLTRKLLPGQHTLKITNRLLNKVKYKMWFEFTTTQLPVDPWDKANKGNTPDTAIGLGELSPSPFISKVIPLSTLHHPKDIDYFAFRLPPLPSWAIEEYCDKAKGPNGAKIIPGNFTIHVERNDLHRVLRTVVYKTDAQGKLIHDINKAFRPWGWETKKQVITCPYKHFKNGRVIFSVEDCSDAQGHSKVSANGECSKTKRHYYKIRITFSFTSEAQVPKQLPSLDMLPEMPDFGPIPIHLTPNAVEFIINQGQDFMELLPMQLKTAYGFDRLMDRANKAAADIMMPGNLNFQYKQHFVEHNELPDIE